MTIGRLPALAPDIVLADFETEIVVLLPDRRRAVHLDVGHALVLDSCRRGDSVDDLVTELASASGSEPAAVELWLDGVVRELARVGAVTPTDG